MTTDGDNLLRKFINENRPFVERVLYGEDHDAKRKRLIESQQRQFNTTQKLIDQLMNVMLDHTDTDVIDIIGAESHLGEYKSLFLQLPRQVGKTTYLQKVAERYKNPLIVVNRISDRHLFIKDLDSSLHPNVIPSCVLTGGYYLSWRGHAFNYDCLLIDEIRDTKRTAIEFVAKRFALSGQEIPKDFFILGLST